jgi:hypothetical protein
MSRLSLPTVFLLSLLAASCGGGSGGDGDYYGAPEVRLEAEPTALDTGDRLLLTVRLEGIYQDGVQLKLRYPRQLAYVEDSGALVLRRNDAAIPIDPDLDVAFGQGGERFLVFYLSAPLFQESEGDGEITLEFSANEEMTEGEIAVDADVSAGSFDPLRPEFTTKDYVSITVQPED